MKITQEPKFQPITLVLETEHEAKLLWDAIRDYAAPTAIEQKMLNNLSDWFTHQAQL